MAVSLPLFHLLTSDELAVLLWWLITESKRNQNYYGLIQTYNAWTAFI